MPKRLIYRIILILAVIGLSLWFAIPLEKRINLGLDLKGGMHLILKVDTSKLLKEAIQDAPERALEIIRNRIDEFGVREPLIHLQGQDRIVVQLPGITDRKRALDLIGKTALLEFKLVSRDQELIKKAISGEKLEGFELKYLDDEPLLLESQAVITGDLLISANLGFDESRFGEPIVHLEFSPEGAKKFAKITEANVGRRLAIILDGKLYSAPRINEPIPSGKAVITGRFTPQEAKDLAIVLRIGALPCPLNIEEERTVGPTLGQDSIRKGIRSAIIGGVCVLGFMAFYYLLCGVIADICLLLNLLIILGGLGLFGATLTLPGIAGIILTLGMSVDANVLIYERIREELKYGISFSKAIENGYKKAFSAIFDSNITTLIAALLLIQFGTGPIKGFAVTLSIGIVSSFFTAIFVSRTILEILLTKNLIKSVSMQQFFRETNIDFIGKKGIFFAISIILISVGLVFFFKKGKDIYGIDFSGGQLQEYRFSKIPSLENVRSSLKEIGLDSVSLQQFKDQPEVILVRTSSDTANSVFEKLKVNFKDVEILRVENVGPIVGKQLRKKAISALFCALLGILIYISFRFKHLNFAIAGAVALFHDVLITIGFLALTNRQIDLLIVTALLTIAGYSINDTIVIYDRVREILKKESRKSLPQIINLAVNQTLNRTVITSFTTILSVLAIFYFGGEILKHFSFSLLVGFISGVYSTVYIASSLVLILQPQRHKIATAKPQDKK